LLCLRVNQPLDCMIAAGEQDSGGEAWPEKEKPL
jgi:hypothetical protein